MARLTLSHWHKSTHKTRPISGISIVRTGGSVFEIHITDEYSNSPVKIFDDTSGKINSIKVSLFNDAVQVALSTK